MNAECPLCSRVKKLAQGEDAQLIAEMDTGFAVLGDYQFFRGYSLLISRRHAAELHDLPSGEKEKFLLEMSQLGEAVCRAVKPVKINTEMLGNQVAHCHWHIFPRHSDDPFPKDAVWSIPEKIRMAESARLSPVEKSALILNIRGELEKIRSRPGVK